MELKSWFKISLVHYAIFLALFNLYVDARKWEPYFAMKALVDYKNGTQPLGEIMFAESDVRFNPGNSDTFLSLAQTYWKRGQHFYGYRNYLKALKINPSIGKANMNDYQKVMREGAFTADFYQVE